MNIIERWYVRDLNHCINMNYHDKIRYKERKGGKKERCCRAGAILSDSQLNHGAGLSELMYNDNRCFIIH